MARNKLRLLAVLFLAVFGVEAQAQQAPTPKKDPFAGFGNTGLDRKGGSKMQSNTPSAPTAPAFQLPPSGAPPTAPAIPRVPQGKFAPETAVETGTGIALAKGWQGHMTQAAGGQTMKIADLNALLAGFGSPEADIGPHRNVTIYEGPRPDGSANPCRVTYLMPLGEAEAALFKSRPLRSSARAVAPGFPDGLYLQTYDVHFGIYNRLTLVTDAAQPQPQVISMLLKADGVNWYPPYPFQMINRDWHTFDFVNAANRGQEKIHIDMRVADLRETTHSIIVNSTGGYPPVPFPPGGYVAKPATASPKVTTAWYVPEPLIKLILYCAASQSGK